MSRARREDGRGRLVLILCALLGVGLLLIPFFLTPPASLEITLRDGMFGLDLEGKPAVLQVDRGGALTVPLRRNGEGYLAYAKRVPSGAGSLQLEVPGYRPEPLSYEAAPLATVRLVKDLVPTFGRLDLSVVDARDADRPVPAKVQIDGVDMPSESNPHALPPGEHIVKVKAQEESRFCPAEQKVVIRERETLEQLLPLSPTLEGDQVARLILDWDENPGDLDAHLDLADSPDAGSSAHVFFMNKRGVSKAGQVLAELDVDHQQSEGFETVTVYNRAQGTYRYLVHLFAGNGTLGTSKASAQVLTKNCASETYKVPAACSSRWWYVADIKLGAAGATVTRRNECLAEPPVSWRQRRK